MSPTNNEFGLDSDDDEDLLALTSISSKKSQPVPTKLANDDEFDFDSSDDGDLLALASQIETQTPQKRPLNSLEDAFSIDFIGSKKPKVSVDPAAFEILKKTFHLDNFRHLQGPVISRLIAGESAVVIFPTGGGKSLCYQLPSLAINGLTLVVSPLIALMKDQVEALKRLGIHAASFDSSKSREEYFDTVNAIKDGTLKILYVAPERLNNENFVETIIERAHTGSGVGLIAIDEAHCVSEWGHAFRPDYLKVARFVKEINAKRVVCLTATATTQVASDICRSFNINEREGLFRTSSYRPNLTLSVESIPSSEDGDLVRKYKLDRLISFLQAHLGSTIIYVTLQKQAESVAEGLNKAGIKALFYHAGIETVDRTRVQDTFMQEPNTIIVATIAFGMGIDKADIRYVIHFDIPRSLEGYSQEVGRAGRDGKPSECVLFLCGNDLKQQESFARGGTPALGGVIGLLQEIFTNHAGLRPGEIMEIALSPQTTAWDMPLPTLHNLYAQLELHFGLFRAITPKYSKFMYKPASNFSKTHIDATPESAFINKHARLAKLWYNIDVDSAPKNKLTRASVIRKLNQWNDDGMIELKSSGVINCYRVESILPSTDQEIVTIASKLHVELRNRERDALQRVQSVVDWATSKACLAAKLAAYFGDKIPVPDEKCGRCTYCKTGNPAIFHPAPKIPIRDSLLEGVVDLVSHREVVDAVTLARIAFGIMSPRVRELKVAKAPEFGSMDDCDFEDLVTRFQSFLSTHNSSKSSSSNPSTSPSKYGSLRGRGSLYSRGGNSTYRAHGRGRGGYA